MMLQRDKRTRQRQQADGGGEYPTVRVEILHDELPAVQQEISVVDINDNGMGIACLVPLKVGQQIVFAGNQQNWELPERGVVMWTFKASNGFRAGIKFL